MQNLAAQITYTSKHESIIIVIMLHYAYPGVHTIYTLDVVKILANVYSHCIIGNQLASYLNHKVFYPCYYMWSS